MSEEFIPLEQAEAQEKSAPDLGLRWHGDETSMEPRTWLVTDLLPETGSGILSAQWGLGKTFSALDLSASVMTGTSFAGREVARQGGVLFVAAEGAAEIPVRLRGLAEHRLDLPDDDRLPFAWVEDCNLRNGFHRLVDQAKAAAAEMKTRFGQPLALIIIDTLAAAGEFADANDAAEAQRIMNRLGDLSRKTGALVLAVDHFGKDTTTGTRGSSAKEAAADVVLAVIGDRDTAGAVSNTRMAVRKLRGGSCGTETPFKLRVVKVGDETTCIIDWSEPAEAPAAAARSRWPKSLRILKDALAEVLAREGVKRRPYGYEGPEVNTVPVSAVRAEFYSAYPADGDDEMAKQATKRSAFNRALSKARGDGLIGSREIGSDDHIWLIDESERTERESREKSGSFGDDGGVYLFHDPTPPVHIDEAPANEPNAPLESRSVRSVETPNEPADCEVVIGNEAEASSLPDEPEAEPVCLDNEPNEPNETLESDVVRSADKQPHDDLKQRMVALVTGCRMTAKERGVIKLTEEGAQFVCDALRAGFKQTEVARMAGVSKQAVNRWAGKVKAGDIIGPAPHGGNSEIASGAI